MPSVTLYRERQDYRTTTPDKVARTDFYTAQVEDGSCSDICEESVDDGEGVIDVVRVGMEPEAFDLLLPSSTAAIRQTEERIRAERRYTVELPNPEVQLYD
jgi:hypothetical protein